MNREISTFKGSQYDVQRHHQWQPASSAEKISNPKHFCHVNVSEQNVVLASKVVAFSADAAADPTAESRTYLKPADDGFVIATRRNQGENWFASLDTNTEPRTPMIRVHNYHLFYNA
jgi:hypothetical protein